MDFRKLNSILKQKENCLPTIDKMFLNIRGFIFASTIDLNMGYLSIPLTPDTQKLLTIVTPFGFFECCVLPMGVKPATDIFQSRMVEIFISMSVNKPNPYIDNIVQGKGKDFNDHLIIRDNIFQQLKEAGMQVNLTKSTLWSKEVKFLRFLLKENGYQPSQKRIKAILRIDPPKNVKRVREFLGKIKFIKNHIPNWAGIPSPITHLTKKDIPFAWEEETNQAFNKVKAEIANAICAPTLTPIKNSSYTQTPCKSMQWEQCLLKNSTVLSKSSARSPKNAQLKYTIGKQELLTAHDACQFFHDII